MKHKSKMFALISVFFQLLPAIGARAESSTPELNPKVEQTIQDILSMAGNDQVNEKKNYFITLAEGQSLIRLMYSRQVVNLKDLYSIKTRIRQAEGYRKLNAPQRGDVEKYLRQVVYVVGEMREYEFKDKMHCRFALRDDPYDEIPDDDFAKSPELYKSWIPAEIIAQEIADRDGRNLFGFCWEKNQRDPYRTYFKALINGEIPDEVETPLLPEK